MGKDSKKIEFVGYCSVVSNSYDVESTAFTVTDIIDMNTKISITTDNENVIRKFKKFDRNIITISLNNSSGIKLKLDTVSWRNSKKMSVDGESAWTAVEIENVMSKRLFENKFGKENLFIKLKNVGG